MSKQLFLMVASYIEGELGSQGACELESRGLLSYLEVSTG